MEISLGVVRDLAQLGVVWRVALALRWINMRMTKTTVHAIESVNVFVYLARRRLYLLWRIIRRENFKTNRARSISFVAFENRRYDIGIANWIYLGFSYFFYRSPARRLYHTWRDFPRRWSYFTNLIKGFSSRLENIAYLWKIFLFRYL